MILLLGLFIWAAKPCPRVRTNNLICNDSQNRYGLAKNQTNLASDTNRVQKRHLRRSTTTHSWVVARSVFFLLKGKYLTAAHKIPKIQFVGLSRNPEKLWFPSWWFAPSNIWTGPGKSFNNYSIPDSTLTSHWIEQFHTSITNHQKNINHIALLIFGINHTSTVFTSVQLKIMELNRIKSFKKWRAKTQINGRPSTYIL